MSRDTMNDEFDDEDIEWDETDPSGAEADDVDEDDDAAPIESMVHDGMNALEFDFDDEDEEADEDDELASTLNE